QAEQELMAHLRNFFATMDFAQYAGAQDINIIVTVTDTKSGKLLGIIQFLVSPSFADGNVRVCLFGLASEAHDRGIEKLLVSSIFKIVPDITRLFLHTRVTNSKALDLYQSWGFERYAGPLADWADLEYVTEKAATLQKVALALEQ
ncbi:MAG TPA: GNAT family N-acetyltransferase, partial [Candidatus Limnocylindria bacterium]|nr:GNAT family N-acetyltransferase [Candidatus Limnocylindria bacterium]